MKTKFITVNKHVIGANRKYGRSDPPLRVQRGKSGSGLYGHEVRVREPGKFVYESGEKPLLKCGARLAFVTEAKCVLVCNGKELEIE